MTPSPMRAENQRVPSEIAASRTARPAMTSAIWTMPPAVPCRPAIRLTMSPASSGRDDADHARSRPPAAGRTSGRAGRAGRCRGSGARCPWAARVPVDRRSRAGTTAWRPSTSWDGPRPHRLLPVDRPTRGSGRPVPEAVWSATAVRNRRRAPAAAAPARPARRRPARRASLRTADRTSSAVARLASTGGGGQRARPGRRRRRPARRPGRRGWPARSRAPRRRCTARPVRQISSARAVADELDQVAGAGQVGDEAEGRLGQPQLRVVGEDPQVAGERELAAGADRVALHGGDGDDPGRAQPAEARLVLADAVARPRRPGAPPRSPRPPAHAGLGAEQAAVEARRRRSGPRRARRPRGRRRPATHRSARASTRWPASGR